jgi:hypothetical protein
MKFNFFDIFKYVLYRRTSNKIIDVSIDTIQQKQAAHRENLINKGYIVPGWGKVVKTLLLTGWIMVIPYIVLSFILIANGWDMAENIFSVIYLLLLLFLYFEERVVYKKKEIPVYKADMRYKTGKKQVDTKIIDDKETAMPMPKNAIIINFICNTIVILYFLGLGLTAAYGIHNFYKKDNAIKVNKTENI